MAYVPLTTTAAFFISPLRWLCRLAATVSPRASLRGVPALSRYRKQLRQYTGIPWL